MNDQENNDKPKVGRPTDYRQEYCDTIIELGKQGKSRAQMAAHLGTSKDSLTRWAEGSEEFRVALARADTFAQSNWEDRGEILLEKQHVQQQIYIKTMQARFSDDYTERKELTGRGGTPINVLMTGADEDA